MAALNPFDGACQHRERSLGRAWFGHPLQQRVRRSDWIVEEKPLRRAAVRARDGWHIVQAAARAPEPTADGRIQQRFADLAAAWERDTRALSSITQAVMHPAYQQIIGMGPAAIPLIVNELRRNPGHWFWALRCIAGEDPVPAAHAGDVARMRDAWLAWAGARGY